ncbi:hypothetical protein MKEN_00654500 [Mycena kentingensis (nom. inval.)]|nr:hypothetical protein MKEN_00654500 [Mycena kentingensis (nom. inval.)]
MDASQSAPVPRLRLSRQPFTPVSDTHTPDNEAGPSRSDTDTDAQPTPRIHPASALQSSEATQRLRAALAREKPTPSRPQSPSETELESDFEPPRFSPTQSGIAKQSLKDLFSSVLADTPSKRTRRGSTSEVEDGPSSVDRTKLKGKRKSLSDEEAEMSMQSTSTSRSEKFKTLNDQLQRSHSQLKDQAAPTAFYDTSNADESADTATFLRELGSTKPIATSTPAHSLEMSQNSKFQTNLMDQDSEMQNLVQNLDSYEGESGRTTRPVSFPSSSQARTPRPGNGHASTSKRASYAGPNSVSRNRTHSDANDHDSPQHLHDLEKNWGRHHATRHNSHSTSSPTAAANGHVRVRTKSTASIHSQDGTSSRGTSTTSQSDHKERMQELDKERDHEREQGWNKHRVSRSGSNLAIPTNRTRKLIDHPSESSPFSAAATELSRQTEFAASSNTPANKATNAIFLYATFAIACIPGFDPKTYSKCTESTFHEPYTCSDALSDKTVGQNRATSEDVGLADTESNIDSHAESEDGTPVNSPAVLPVDPPRAVTPPLARRSRTPPPPPRSPTPPSRQRSPSPPPPRRAQTSIRRRTPPTVDDDAQFQKALSVPPPPSPPPSPPTPTPAIASMPPIEPEPPTMSMSSLLSTPQKRPSLYTSKLEFRTPSPPQGLADLADLSSPEKDSETERPALTPLRYMADTTMKTPRPPGAWMTPAPPAKKTSLPPAQTSDNESQYSGGLATPGPSLSRGSALPTETPKPPGAWMTTPAARKSVLQVRFDERPSELELSAIEESTNGQGEEQSQSEVSDTGLATPGDEPGYFRDHTPEPVAPVSPAKSPRRSPTINIVDEYGRRSGGKTSGSSSPKASPRHRKKKNSIRVLDAMGREVHPEASIVKDEPLPPLNRDDAFDFVRSGVSELRSKLDELDLSADYSDLDRERMMQLDNESRAARAARDDLEKEYGRRAAQLRANMLNSKMVSEPSYRRPARTRFWAFIIMAQVLFLLLLYRHVSSPTLLHV